MKMASTKDRAPRKKAINSKKKGSEFELQIAKELGKWWGEEFHRTPASGGLRWQKDNRILGDIVTPEESKFPFVVECKKREGWDFLQLLPNVGEINKWWKQVLADSERSEKNLRPMLVFSKNFARNFVMFSVSDVESLLPDFKGNMFILKSDEYPDRVVFLLEDMANSWSREAVLDKISRI